MRRLIALVAAAISIAAVGVGIAWSAPSPKDVGHPSDLKYFTFYGTGPSASCNGDSCGLGTVAPLRMNNLPATTFDATVTVSFGYITQGDNGFKASVSLQTASAPHSTVGALLPPNGRTLAPAPLRNSTTLVFHIGDITGGQKLNLTPWVTTSTGPSPSSISLANVSVDVDFTNK